MASSHLGEIASASGVIAVLLGLMLLSFSVMLPAMDAHKPLAQQARRSAARDQAWLSGAAGAAFGAAVLAFCAWVAIGSHV